GDRAAADGQHPRAAVGVPVRPRMRGADEPWRSLGLAVRRAIRLSRHGAAPAFRLDLEDGRTLKGRVFPTPRWAAAVRRLLAAPGARALPRPCLRSGLVL